MAHRLGLVGRPPEPIRCIFWTVAQVVGSSLYPLWVHAQRHGTILEVGECDRRDLPVVVEHVSLGEPCLRPVHFLQVRDLDALIAELPRFR